MKIEIPVCQPTVGEEDVAAVSKVLRSRWLSTGSEVHCFEEALSELTGYPHVVAVSSCTAALFLSLRALGIGPGKIVGVPALTFTATAAAVRHTGADVVFLDVDPVTWQLNAGRDVRGLDAVVPVDLYGQTFSRSAIAQWKLQGVVVVEDAAHAVGADLAGGADVACLSFYATKNITTCGEGGAVLARDEGIARAVRQMSMHGLTAGAAERYRAPVFCDVARLGYKANMTDVQAAMGCEQIQRLSTWRLERNAIAARYDQWLPRLGRPARFPDGIVHLYPILLPEGQSRGDFVRACAERGVGIGVHYQSLTDTAYWRAYLGLADAGASEGCSVAERIGRRVVSLPLYPHLKLEEQARVARAVEEALR